jgi:hypothetical protein
MTNVCAICSHKRRLEIDREIVQGKNLSKIARDYDVSYDSVFNHSKVHISRQLAKALEQKMQIEGNNLMETIQSILDRAEDIFQRNYDAGKDLTALKAIDSIRNTIQLLNNISAQLHAAKMAELQLEKENLGDNKQKESEQYMKLIKILSFDELLVYQRLIDKIGNQTTDKIILNSKVIEEKNNYGG